MELTQIRIGARTFPRLLLAGGKHDVLGMKRATVLELDGEITFVSRESGHLRPQAEVDAQPPDVLAPPLQDPLAHAVAEAHVAAKIQIIRLRVDPLALLVQLDRLGWAAVTLEEHIGRLSSTGLAVSNRGPSRCAEPRRPRSDNGNAEAVGHSASHLREATCTGAGTNKKSPLRWPVWSSTA